MVSHSTTSERISPNRGERDIRLLRKYFIKTSADIGIQEVNDVSIISKVVGSDYKVILFTKEAKPKTKSINLAILTNIPDLQ